MTNLIGEQLGSLSAHHHPSLIKDHTAIADRKCLSRALLEEVRSNANGLQSTDWASYPILEIADAPEAIDIVLVNRPELPPSGGGEPSTRTVPAATAAPALDAPGHPLHLQFRPRPGQQHQAGDPGGTAAGPDAESGKPQGARCAPAVGNRPGRPLLGE